MAGACLYLASLHTHQNDSRHSLSQYSTIYNSFIICCGCGECCLRATYGGFCPCGSVDFLAGCTHRRNHKISTQGRIPSFRPAAVVLFALLSPADLHKPTRPRPASPCFCFRLSLRSVLPRKLDRLLSAFLSGRRFGPGEPWVLGDLA